MTKSTRNYLIVAALAALAVGVDRLTGVGEDGEETGPVAAAAAPAASPAPPPPPASPLAVAARPQPASPPNGVGRLDLRLLRDGPAVVEAGLQSPFQPRARGPVAAPPPPVVAPMDVPAFLTRRPLAAVLGQGGNARAVVAGEVLRVGDTRDGMTLEAIHGRFVVWSGAGIRFAAGLRAAERHHRTAPAEAGASVGAPKADPVAALFDR